MKALVLYLLLVIPSNAKKIEIIFTNDIQGIFGRTKATWINPDFPPPLGGKGSFRTFLKEEREKAKSEGIPLLLFDSGNFTGGYITGENLPLKETVEFFKEFKYNAINLGVREFIVPFKAPSDELTLEKYLKMLETPVVASNVRLSEDTTRVPPFVHKYLLFEVNGVKIGVFGLVSENTPFFALEKNIDGLYIKKEKETAREIVNELKKKGADIIILLSSLGYYRELFLAEEVPGIDVILGGFDGRGLREAIVDSINHTIIVRNYSGLSQVGKLTLIVDPTSRKVLNFSFKAISLLEEEIPIEE